MTDSSDSKSVRGIHHITAISSDPGKTVKFYTQVLGLRMVKLTVNFDDPSTYHLYFGDKTGKPGSILTFFPFPLAGRGKPGAGQVTAVAFRVPIGSLEFWAERLSRFGYEFDGPFDRFGSQAISFSDFDGLPLELVASSTTEGDLESVEVPAEHSITEFDGVTMTVRKLDRTTTILTKQLGMMTDKSSDNIHRFTAGTGVGHSIDLLHDKSAVPGVPGAGTVHHIAWRCGTDEQQGCRDALAEFGLNVTSILDRNYFRSIYFREPGGVLFEIATDEPGFAIDEPVEQLGSSLKLPEWLESKKISD